MKNKILNILTKSYNKELANIVVDSFKTISDNYELKLWKPSEVDGGIFVEAVRRIIELELFGSYTPINKNLPNFDDQVLHKYENATGDESFRMLIPRALKSIYNIRSKRGATHIKSISPNLMDSTYILFSTKWVLAELVRIKSNLDACETQLIIDQIVDIKIDIIWKENDIERVLNTKISKKDQILVLLFYKSPRKDDELRKITEYTNKANFIGLLKAYHDKRLIEYDESGECRISPLGKIEAKRLIFQNRLEQ